MAIETTSGKKTCQVCGRPIMAGKGAIAHHGYTRPEPWIQTASCPGAKYLPYEESCNRLREVITWVQAHLDVTREELNELMENPPESLIVNEKRGSYGCDDFKTYTRPEGFDTHSHLYATRSGFPRTYENAHKKKAGALRMEIERTEHSLTVMEQRIAAWKPQA